MKRILVLILAAALLLGAIWYTRREELLPVTLHTVERGVVERTVANTRAGTIKACRRSALSMPGGGRVEVLHVKEGQEVAAGELLLELWNEDRRAMTAQAESQLAAASHRREQLCVEADNAAREARRLATLQQRKLVSEELAQAADTRARSAAFACRAAGDEQQTAVASLQMNRALLAETQLRAPFAGIVAEINGEVGEFVTPSPPGIPMPPAVDLIDYSCLYVTAPIDEVDAGRLKTGLPARISLDAFRGEHFAGRLDRIAPYVMEIEKQARTVDVDVLFTNAADRERLLVGYSADIDLVLEAHADAIRIPSEALMDNDTVYRFDPASSRLERVAVQTGIRNWNFTEITAGLAPGDRVVTSLDQQGLAEGVLATPADD
ncbi:MAG: efflux RND transporter periplasmic adaptor subunit [Pseudomonadales bacterium]|nr:efflux RND transporter periplasmic adaptor subunit [Pseudomonadales bacterium]MBP7911566.1 efflux RND transporter periplasmic adaptor subunit [Pseudomonadales bacterium]